MIKSDTAFWLFSINTLASEQKDEIMEQLESIRKLMKESGLDKSAMKPQGTFGGFYAL